LAQSRARRKARIRSQAGYALITVLFFLMLLIVAAMSQAPSVVGQIRRDREMELVNRGAQYARAIKKFYRKFGRYPMNIEQLENTNQIRFLRKRYKDPVTGEDFRLLHFGEVSLTPKSPGAATNPGIPAANLAGASSGSKDTKKIGGGPIVGVASTSEQTAMMEFNKKTKYNEWEFVYDPSIDRGGLIKGPYNGQPGLGSGSATFGSPLTGGQQQGAPQQPATQQTPQAESPR